VIHMPHLETDITQACQLSCVGCNHSVPLWRTRKGGPWAADPAQVEKDLNNLARVVHTDRWGALGGEPLLHRDLVAILTIARDSKIADLTEVWSNGILLPRQPAAFWRAFDVLVLSVYPGKHTPESLAWIHDKCRDEGVALVVKDEGVHPNFKTMLEPRPDTDPAYTAHKFRTCFFRWFSRVANFGHLFTCCCGPHLPMLMQGRDYGADGIPITDTMTEADVEAYLHRSQPLGACTICAGRDTARPITWHEEKDPERWKAASAGLSHP
jgi:cyclic pyranopterin phosphate synthase